MRIIDRYIWKEVFSHALLGLLIFTFVLFVPDLVKLMEFVVRSSAPPSQLGLLFVSLFPSILTFTLPMAVLVGVLIGLGRLSADSELIALSALGVGMRRVLVPVGAFAAVITLLTLSITLWLGPAAQRTFGNIRDQMTASQAPFQVQPRVFDEEPKDFVLYVQDVTASATRWRGVFLAQTQSKKASSITLAAEAIVVSDPQTGKLELHLRNGSTHEYLPSDPGRYNVITFVQSDFPVAATGVGAGRTSAVANSERSVGGLLSVSGPGERDARIEVQRRFAFPVACLVFALLAVPLAARPRRGGRAMGFIISLLLVCAYYLLIVVGTGLARDGKLSVAMGIWGANLLTGIVGLALLPGMEQIRSATMLSRFMERWSGRIGDIYQKLHDRMHREQRPGKPTPVPAATHRAGGIRKTEIAKTDVEGKVRVLQPRPVHQRAARVQHYSGFPQLLDLYLLRNFVFYLVLVMAGFIFLFEVFTFFELLDDIARHHTPFLIVLDYFRFLVPYLFYHLTPFATLVAALITIALMSKNNEIVAMKASGVSLYRLAWPLIGASAVLALGLITLDNTYLPYFNQRQDALRAIIKGKPAQTYLRPNRSWISGSSNKFYNYEVFDPDNNLFGGLNVFEVDPQTFQLSRRVFASRAIWSPKLNTWLLESGWVRDFEGREVARYTPFQADTLPELNEPPEHFNREVRHSDQMNWRELNTYIAEIHQAGFDVSRLTVQWHEKLAFPLIAPIITFLAIPFAFFVGTRGAIGGLAIGIGVGITYWAASALCEALGGVGQMTPVLAAWAPDVIFIFFGSYFFFKMPT
jgi:LPS export ABC transporter permease LptF/LPS export ABC transporter permease LptG